MRKGIPVSPGVTIGNAYCIHDVFVDPRRTHIDESEVATELARFENARKRAIRDLQGLQEKVEAQVGKDAAAVFAVHESILHDASLIDMVHNWISEEHLSAPAALARLVDHYRALLERTNDPYLNERLADIRDVVERLTGYLSPVLQEGSKVLPGPVIVVAHELLPSQAVTLGKKPVHGIVTEVGSQTSHAAIIARSRGIPAICGVSGILNQVKTGDVLVVDGREGHVLINPEPEVLAAYRKLEREFFDLRDQLAHNREQPAITRDGTPIELLANINGPADAKAAVAMGASGVGLYRTEYLYLTHPSVPGEEEQLEVYRQVIEQSPNHRVTIRTLDIGGDKTVPFLGREHSEANPFMGWRSIRLSFEHPQFFLSQIRAIMRAAAPFGEVKQPDVRLLFPMVTTIEELRRLKAIVRRAQEQLKEEGKEFRPVPFGIMIEVPAAAVMIDEMVESVDFVSIGSNDLIQYLMAADRDNPRVSHLCQPLSPAVLRVLEVVVRSCNRARKPVTLCGEMAASPPAFVMLLGMGLRQFSMSPAFIPTIKEVAAHISIADARQLLAKAKGMKTTRRIRRMLNSELQRLVPSLRLMLTE